jgi:hypothetical protein
MVLIVGEKVQSVITAKVYRIRHIGDSMAVLESEDKSSQVLTTTGNLELFYMKEEFRGQLKN